MEENTNRKEGASHPSKHIAWLWSSVFLLAQIAWHVVYSKEIWWDLSVFLNILSVQIVLSMLFFKREMDAFWWTLVLGGSYCWFVFMEIVVNHMPLNATIIRMGINVLVLFWIGGLLIKNKVSIIKKLLLIGMFGLLSVQCIHFVVMYASLKNVEQVYVKELNSFVSLLEWENMKDICKKREIHCVRGKGVDELNIKVNNKYIEEIYKLLNQNAVDKSKKFGWWSFSKEWSVKAVYGTPIVVYGMGADGERYAVLDGKSLYEVFQTHKKMFSLVTALSSIGWGVGACLLVVFHQMRFRRRRHGKH